MLSALVPFQNIRSTKSFIADIAFVRFLVRVNTLVPFQITRLTIPLLAHITFVRLLVRVNTLVPFQMTSLMKSLLAHITFVRLLVCVNTHVNLQITSSTKSYRTHPPRPGILKHNTKGSSFATFKTVLAFTVRLGCGFFRLLLIILLSR